MYLDTYDLDTYTVASNAWSLQENIAHLHI